MSQPVEKSHGHQAQTTTASRRRICDLPAEERPLYRLHQHGSDALATTELLALVLGMGEAPGIATDLLARFGSLHKLARASKAQLMQVRGIGEAQAARLVAILELSRRLQTPARLQPGRGGGDFGPAPGPSGPGGDARRPAGHP